MNTEGLNPEDVEVLRNLNSIEECQYAEDFYDFEVYLKKFQNMYQCDVNGCQKLYFDLRLLK
jgi:hypothetical protein